MNFDLQNEFDQVSWYGRGPHENYWDRKTSSFIGIYESDIDNLSEYYETPQENGNRTDTRWVKFENKKGEGLAFAGYPSIDFSALYFTPYDLTLSQRGEKHTYELSKNDFINVNIDYKQTGIGGDDSWGARTHSKYTLWSKPYSYSFKIIPYAKTEDIKKYFKY